MAVTFKTAMGIKRCPESWHFNSVYFSVAREPNEHKIKFHHTIKKAFQTRQFAHDSQIKHLLSFVNPDCFKRDKKSSSIKLNS